MTTPQLATEFIQRAVELGFLTTPHAEQLTRETIARRETPATVGLQLGLLSPEQIEILSTLLKPREIAPGYEIVSLLGYGGMGVVYRARQLALQREVALKTILLTQLGHGKAVERFAQEATTIGRLVHPHIITAYDFGNHAGRLFLAMELVDGIDGDSWIKKTGPLDEASAWQIARQAAAGLAHASHLGIVHRDIKPANLLLVAPPTGFPLPSGLPLVKIADFGLAMLRTHNELQTRITTHGAVLGSPHYMAPEQFDAVEVDQRADIYALGATVFHLLSGAPPWAQLNLSQVMGKKLLGDVPSLTNMRTDCRPETIQLLNSMLALQPTQRPQNYAEVMQRIDTILSLLPPTTCRFSHDGHFLHDPLRTERFIPSTEKIALGPPTTPVITSSVNSTRRILSALLGITLLLGLLAWSLWSPARQEPDCLPEDEPIALFNGKSLEPPLWQVINGQWSPEVSPENGFVFTGKAPAAISRRFVEIPSVTATWQISLNVEPLAPAGITEIMFDLPSSPNSQPECLVLRWDKNLCEIGRRSLTPEKSWVELKRIPLRQQTTQHVQISGHSELWWIQIADENVRLPRLHPLPSPEIQLRCVEGEASFFDLQWQRLKRP